MAGPADASPGAFDVFSGGSALFGSATRDAVAQVTQDPETAVVTFFQRYPCDTRAIDYFGLATPEVQAKVMATFRPKSEGDPDYSAAVTSFVKRCLQESQGVARMGGDWICGECGDLQFARNTQCRKCGSLPVAPLVNTGSTPAGWTSAPGDWTCPACGDLQFARNTKCRKCGTPPPSGSGPSDSGKVSYPGDWNCDSCGDLQFARNTKCRKCSAPRKDITAGFAMPDDNMEGDAASNGGAESPGNSFISLPGDWNCEQCGDLQFARNMQCRKCGSPPPPGAGPTTKARSEVTTTVGGDWICESCGDLQFARNVKCRKCGAPPPGSSPLPASSGALQGGLSHPGDWTCRACGDLQFARNNKCRKCGAPPASAGRPSSAPSMSPRTGGMSADWTCPACGDFQFGRNTHCRKCGSPPATASAGADSESGNAGCSSGVEAGSMQVVGGDWICKACGDLQFARNTKCRKCGALPDGSADAGAAARPGPSWNTSPGDWICSNCQDLQFARNTQCRKCGGPPPANHVGPCASGWTEAPGDWTCGKCGDLQFARNTQCRKCGALPPTDKNIGQNRMSMPGDWTCAKCGDLQFARNMKCRKCGAPPSNMTAGGPAPGGMAQGKMSLPGDWHCPKCGDLQFARNAHCRKCGAMPEDKEGSRRSSPY
eukprot:TRINITY_DN3072_c0_g2_i1.p1 TRINITY_DN3072_c0_g2~~TRINITY_DN3072_c0_g2_i1.p1  ORF type:complete len:657 (+),score=84.79 TRINITY_DN3072_c0_g2_i1:195-2165(+)